MPKRLSILALLFAVAATACGGGGGDEAGSGADAEGTAASEFEQSYTDVAAYPVLVSNELVVGRNRFVVGLLDDQDAPLADPKIEMEVSFFDLAGEEPEPLSSEEMQWVWIEEGVRGYYIGNVEFAAAGEIGVEVKIDGSGIEEVLRSKATVVKESTTPAYGEIPPASDTPTLADVDDLKAISTDTTPVRRFYRYSIAEALERGEPSVVVFATPKFCASAVCAPTLDVVQEAARGFRDVAFVHVEPYELEELPEALVPVEAMEAWRLPTEPWVFVMDEDGRVAEKYEGVMAPEELRSALERLS
jgi:hypothetical protein